MTRRLKAWLLVFIVSLGIGLGLATIIWPRPPQTGAVRHLVLATTLSVDHPFNQQLLAGIAAGLSQPDSRQSKTLPLPDDADQQARVLADYPFQAGDQLLLHSDQVPELMATLDAWHQRGVIITLIDSASPDSSHFGSWGQTPQESGRALAQTVLAQQAGPTALLYLGQDANSQARQEAALEVLRQHEVTVYRLALGSDKLENQALADSFFAAHSDIAQVLLLDETSSRQLARYLSQTLKQTAVYGLGYHQELMAAVAAGYLQGNLTPNPYAMGYLLAQAKEGASQADTLAQVVDAQDLVDPQKASWLFPLE